MLCIRVRCVMYALSSPSHLVSLAWSESSLSCTTLDVKVSILLWRTVIMSYIVSGFFLLVALKRLSTMNDVDSRDGCSLFCWFGWGCGPSRSLTLGGADLRVSGHKCLGVEEYIPCLDSELVVRIYAAFFAFRDWSFGPGMQMMKIIECNALPTHLLGGWTGLCRAKVLGKHHTIGFRWTALTSLVPRQPSLPRRWNPRWRA